MTTEITPASKPSYGVTFTKKVSDGNYGGEEFSAWVSADVDPDFTAEQVYDALTIAGKIAKAQVFDQLGITAEEDENGMLQAVVQRVERAFTGTTDVTPQASGPVRVKGEQKAELPTWLIEQAAAAGITEVYDNRGPGGSAPEGNRPFFKATTIPSSSAKGFWPPKGR